MSNRARWATFLLAALIGGCASPPPAPKPALVAARPVLAAPSNGFYPAADDVLIRALGLVGTPYRWGGNTPDSGFDCSGLIGYVYHAAGVVLPRSTREMVNMRAPEVNQKALQSGDLIFFATGRGSQVTHAAIYVGEGRFVHAPATGGTVKLDYLAKPYWQKRYLSAKRILQADHLANNR
jgi:cell wall-associated NlpC family hydrolase